MGGVRRSERASARERGGGDGKGRRGKGEPVDSTIVVVVVVMCCVVAGELVVVVGWL